MTAYMCRDLRGYRFQVSSYIQRYGTGAGADIVEECRDAKLGNTIQVLDEFLESYEVCYLRMVIIRFQSVRVHMRA